MNQDLKEPIIKILDEKRGMPDDYVADQLFSLFESYQAEKYKKIEEAVEFFDPKNKAIPYVKLDQVLAILTKNNNENPSKKDKRFKVGAVDI